MYRSHAARGTGSERLDRRSGEDEQTGQADADQHESGAGGREHPLHRKRRGGAKESASVTELVECGVPLAGAERQLEETGRGDREQCEPQGQANALSWCAASDERNADDDQRDRHGESHPPDEEPDALPQGRSHHAGPICVDPETSDDRHDEARQAGEVALVTLDRLPPTARFRAGARTLRSGGSGAARRGPLAGYHSNHNRNSSNMSNRALIAPLGFDGCCGVNNGERRSGERRGIA